jgi:hypothetical protein
MIIKIIKSWLISLIIKTIIIKLVIHLRRLMSIFWINYLMYDFEQGILCHKLHLSPN